MKKEYSKCIELVKKDEKFIGYSSRAIYFPMVIKDGLGARVRDIDGNTYIDFLSSAAVMNTGYSHPKIIDAIKDQVGKYVQFSTDYLYSSPQVELAERINQILLDTGNYKMVYGHSGSDAVDGAIKLARSYSGRSKIISYKGSYHGSTYGALSLSGISLNMKRKIGPLLPEIYHMPYPNCRNCDFGKSFKDCSIECLGYIERAFETYIPPEEVAAIIIEPIAGDLGFIEPPEPYYKRLETLLSNHGILLVVDEVQNGFGRTGKWFSFQHFNLNPDIIVMGKAMASGMPLSCIAAKDEIMDSLLMPAHLFTLQGNPVSCRASIATIEVIEEEELIENALGVGNYILERLNLLFKEYKFIGDIRGRGLSIGLELIVPGCPNMKNKDAARKISYECWKRGLILIYLAENILRIQPPLVITKNEVDEALRILEGVIRDYENNKIDDEALENVKGW